MTGSRPPQASNRRLFGAAHAARSLGWSVVDLLLAWHLHARMGLTGMQTGWLLFGFLLLGGTATFLVGLAFSRYRARGALVVRVQLPATIATAVLLSIQFSTASILIAVCAGLAFRLAYAVQDVAQNMLASLLPTDAVDAFRYARLRVILSAVTRCIVVSGFALALPISMTVMLVPVGFAMVVSAISLRKLVFPARPDVAPAPWRVDDIMPLGLPILLVAWVIAASLLPTLNRLLIFAPAIDGLNRSGAWLLGGFCLGSVIGPLLRDYVERSALMTMIAVSGLLMILPIPFLSSASWPVAGAIVHGMAVSIIGVQLWTATSRIAMDDTRRDRSSDGVVFGSVILTIHLASAAGMLVLGPLIEGFEAGRPGIAFAALALTFAGALLITAIGVSERRAPAAA